MSGNSIWNVLHLGVVGVMALPLLARSCDVVTTSAKMAEGTARTVSQAKPISSFSDTTVAFRAADSDRSALYKSFWEAGNLLSDTQRISFTAPVEATMRLATALPSQPNDFRIVFGREATANAISEAANANRLLEGFSNASDGTRSAEDLTRIIETSPESVITIIGHNEAGFLKFPDGSSLAINEIAAQCAQAQKRCVILSCESADHIDELNNSTSGVSRVISARDAVFISRRLNAHLKSLRSKGHKVSYQSLDTDIRYISAVSEDLALTVGQAKQASKVVAVGGGIGAVVFFDGNDDN